MTFIILIIINLVAFYSTNPQRVLPIYTNLTNLNNLIISPDFKSHFITRYSNRQDKLSDTAGESPAATQKVTGSILASWQDVSTFCRCLLLVLRRFFYVKLKISMYLIYCIKYIIYLIYNTALISLELDDAVWTITLFIYLKQSLFVLRNVFESDCPLTVILYGGSRYSNALHFIIIISGRRREWQNRGKTHRTTWIRSLFGRDGLRVGNNKGRGKG